MKPSRSFQQIAWLADLLLNGGPLTLQQISDRWVLDGMADGAKLSRTTFNRHREAVGEMFGLNIDVDDTYHYYISNPEATKPGTIEHFALSSLTVGNVLAGSQQVQDRIVLQDVPSGERYLTTIITAIKLGRRVKLSYQRFGCSWLSVSTVSPYGLKFFDSRWYLLGSTGSFLGTYALDRVTALELTDEPFALPKGFSTRDYYADYYGIWADHDVPMQDIRLRAYGTTAGYLRTLPLHHSQREVAANDDHADFALELRPTPDFVSALIARGPGLEVLAPTSLRQQVSRRLQDMLARYDQA